MGNILNEDFSEFLRCLNKANVEYVLVGDYAVIYHGYNRTTGDLDIWVNPTSGNYRKLLSAFEMFDLPVFDMSEEKFLRVADYDVFTFGRPPVSIDIITKATGLTFDETFRNSSMQNFDGIEIRMIDIRDLIRAKKTVNRPKDQDDVQHLSDLH
jgi:predicted nucleotidyltransferase